MSTKMKEEFERNYRKVMGHHKNITHNTFPRQSWAVGARTTVIFHYNTKHKFLGTIIRDDIEEPFETLIQLDDGTTVRSAECQYTLPRKEWSPEKIAERTGRPIIEWIEFWKTNTFEVLETRRGGRSIFTLSNPLTDDALNVEGKELVAFAVKLLIESEE